VLDWLLELTANALGAFFPGCLVSSAILALTIATPIAFATHHAHAGRLMLLGLGLCVLYGLALIAERLLRSR
jgi:hypothetical protein